MTQMGDSVESTLLMDWVLENEPLILIEISKFWLYNSFSLSLHDYQGELSFILKTFESNFNLMIFSAESLLSWLNLLSSLPCYPEDQTILNEHILFILSKIPTNLIPQYFSVFMVNFLVSDSLKKTQRDSLLRLILTRFLLAQQDQQRFDCLIKVFFDKLSEKQF